MMDIGKIGAATGSEITPLKSSAINNGGSSPQPAESFVPSEKQEPRNPKATLKSVSAQSLVLEKNVKPAFELKQEWAIPVCSINPDPNTGPHGEINISSFGNFTVAKEGVKIMNFEMRDPTAKYEGYKTLAVSKPPAFANDGLVYAPDRSGTLHAFDLNKKEKIWEFKTGCHEDVPSPVLGEGNLLFIRDGGGNLYALDRMSGEKKWSLKKGYLSFKSKQNSVPSPENHPPALGPDGTLYVVGKKGALYAIDGKTGSYRDEFKPFEAGESIYYTIPPFCDSEGRVFIASRGAGDPKWTLSCLNGATGERLWETFTGDNIVPPAIGPDGTLYVGTTGATWITKDNPGNHQKIMAIDPATGKTKWEVPVDGRIKSAHLDPSGKKLAVLHFQAIDHPEWEEIEFVDNISILDLSTQVRHDNVNPGKTENDSVHAICFTPDGKLIVYGKGAISANTIKDDNLFVESSGKVLTADEITGGQGAQISTDTGNAILIEGEVISIDGVRLTMKNGRLCKI